MLLTFPLQKKKKKTFTVNLNVNIVVVNKLSIKSNKFVQVFAVHLKPVQWEFDFFSSFLIAKFLGIHTIVRPHRKNTLCYQLILISFSHSHNLQTHFTATERVCNTTFFKAKMAVKTMSVRRFDVCFRKIVAFFIKILFFLFNIQS